MKKSAKKGFTLIELMIVLAIIAILAMVLIPKAGIFKSQSKNAGVMTNANMVRAYLENKTGDNFIVKDATDAGVKNVADGLNAAFKGSEQIKNPINNDTTITSTAPTAAPAVYVVASDAALTFTSLEGTVIVVYGETDKSYTVYGVDSDGNKLSSVVIK